MWSGLSFPTFNLLLVLIPWQYFLFQELLEHTWCWWVCSEPPPGHRSCGTLGQHKFISNFLQGGLQWWWTGLYLHSGFVHQFCFNVLYGRILLNKAKRTFRNHQAPAESIPQPFPEQALLIPPLFLFPVFSGSRGRIDAFGVRAQQWLCVLPMILTALLLFLCHLHFICEKCHNYPPVVISGMATAWKESTMDTPDWKKTL